jgi:hypothetical protein
MPFSMPVQSHTDERKGARGMRQSRNLAWNSAFERRALTSEPSPHTFALDLPASSSRRLSTSIVNHAL